jgi:hypothetical protein
MSSLQPDKNFGGSIAKFYEVYIVPLIFEPYAEDLAHNRGQAYEKGSEPFVITDTWGQEEGHA